MRRTQRGQRRRRRESVGTGRSALGARRHDDSDRHVSGNGAHQTVRALHRSVNNLCIEPQPIALLLHGLAAAGDGVVERRSGSRHRTGDVSPVICQEWKVHHPVPSRRDHFRGSQDQVMILRSVEAGAKPADVAHHVAPQCREMAGVHRRPESLWRPVRFQEMCRLSPVGQHMSLVAVHIVDVAGGINRRSHPLERCRH